MILSAGLVLGQAEPGKPPQGTPSQQELQAPLNLGDEKPTQAGPQEQGASSLRAFGSLVLVLGLAGASLWALKKWGKGKLPGTGGGKLQVEETLALGERRYVSILRAEEERFVIALSPQGISLLAKLGPDLNEAFPPELEALSSPMPVRDMEKLLRGEP